MNLPFLCATLLVGCLVVQVRGQACYTNGTQLCRTNCVSNSATGACCILSAEEPNGTLDSPTPLGFTNYFLSGTEMMEQNPCVRVDFPAAGRGQANVYLVVALESNSGRNICLRQQGTQTEFCAQDDTYFCDNIVRQAGDASQVELEIYCDPPCPDQVSFFIKPEFTLMVIDTENFCANNRIPLPSSLEISGNPIVPEQPQPTVTTAGASCVKPLPLLPLLLLLLAKLF